MRKIKVTTIALIVLTTLSGCKSYYESLFRTQDLDERFRGAMYYYGNGKYRKAASLFESMIFLSQGTDKEDSVQFYNGMSNYRYGDYITAEQNFNKFLEVFPRSAMAEEAKFLRIKCLYEGTYRWELDQVPTQKAMATIAEFIYYTMKDYKSSHYALRTVLRDNSDNRYREEILYYTAMSSYKYAFNSIKEKQKERYMTFIDDYYNFIGEFPRVSERKELDQLFIRAQKVVGLKAGLDSAQVAAAAQLAKEDAVATKSSKNIRADKKNTRKAIREAKKAVREAESRSAVARKVNEETSGTQRQNERRKARKEREEALKIYEQAKAKAKEKAEEEKKK